MMWHDLTSCSSDLVELSLLDCQMEDIDFLEMEEDAANFHGNGAYEDQSSPLEEPHKDELDVENPEEVRDQTDSVIQQAGVEQNLAEVEPKGQEYVPRRSYQNQRGGRGAGGRRGYPNGRGGRGGNRGGGAYQNGRNQYYDQPGNYYPRNSYNGRGRSGRGGGGNTSNNNGYAVQASHAIAGS
ncbi:unnamed protein product [Ilex paraguariensis]|uniref:Glycine-rich protein n=1 Tax=Ilex paraguariensis TaxID=185542 RepID=A0ABC8QNQ6_9AQUA